MARMNYQEVLRKAYCGDFSTIPERLLAIDPGETTGWALFENGYLKFWGQEDTVVLNDAKGAKQGDKIINWEALEELFNRIYPTAVICEDYRIYAHKLDRHSFSKVETLRLIGGIDMMCRNGWMERDINEGSHDDPVPGIVFDAYHPPIPVAYQMAADAKGWVTDDRLQLWDFWKEGMRHSRDAIRHGIYYLMITNRPKIAPGHNAIVVD